MRTKRAERGAERLMDAVGAVLATPAGKARIDCLARRIAGTSGPQWCGACAAAPDCPTLQQAEAKRLAGGLAELTVALERANDHAEYCAAIVQRLTG